MGEHFFGDLTKSFQNLSVSRKRALQLLGGALAVAAPARLPQTAEAAKRRKSPLAFVGATVDRVDYVDATTFSWHVSRAMAHPTSDKKFTFTNVIDIASNLPADKVRANLVAELKSDFVVLSGQAVPKDRIAVTLL